MFKKKNLLVLLIISFLGFIDAFPCFAITEDILVNAKSNNEYYFETFRLEELGNHKDVQDYIIRNGYSNSVKNFINNTQIDNYENQDSQSSIENITKDELSEKTKSEIAQKYGLSRMQSRPNSETYVLVKKNTSSALGNVWYLNYAIANEGFYINILNIGLDKIDLIKGEINVLGLSRNTWSETSDDTFARSNVAEGHVYTYLINRKSVAEKFEYDITVTEDGKTFRYNNKGSNAYERYSFSVDTYNIMNAMGGERHHFVSSNSLAKAGFNTNTAPALRMIVADHIQTANWGNRASSIKFRDEELRLLKEKNYEQLLKLEVDSFKSTPDSEGKFKNLAEKYNHQEGLIYLLAAYEKYFGIMN